MPSSLVQGIVEVVLRCLFEIGAYWVGRWVVPVVSFGRWKCDRLATEIPRRKLRAGGFYHVRGNQVYLTAEGTAAVGIFCVLLVAGGEVLIWYLAK